MVRGLLFKPAPALPPPGFGRSRFLLLFFVLFLYPVFGHFFGCASAHPFPQNLNASPAPLSYCLSEHTVASLILSISSLRASRRSL